MKLSRKQTKGIMLIIGAVFLLVVGLKVSGLTGGKDAGRKAAERDSAETRIPDAERTEMEESKLDAYLAAERIWDANERYSDEDPYSADTVDGGTDQEEDDGIIYREITGSGPSHGRDREKVSSGRPPAPGDAGYREYRMRKYYDNADSTIGHGKAAGDSTASGPDARDSLVQDGNGMPSSVGSAAVRRSSAMSSLDGAEGNAGFSSLSGGTDELVTESEHPFACMFVREEKLKDGTRVSIRLLEDMVVNGTLIPENTHLMATCSIRERLELSISNIEMNSRIYTLGYEAYDSDGGKGIYCPDLNGDAARTAKSRGLSTIGSVIGGRVGRLASSAVRTGVSIAQSRNGEITVTVPAGYRFFILKKKNR